MVDISAANDAGVIGYLDQIQIFVPVSHLGAGQRERQRSDSRTWLGKEVYFLTVYFQQQGKCQQSQILGMNTNAASTSVMSHFKIDIFEFEVNEIFE